MRRLLAGLAAPALLAACATGPDAGRAGDADAGLQVAASFYPLQWVAERLTGDRAQVTSLTPPGAEPHDLELSPREVAALGDSDVVVYLSDFQPAVDDAVATLGGVPAVDVADLTELRPAEGPDAHGHADAADHAGEPGDADPAATDPHFWLDPVLLAEVADGLADELAELDPEGAAQYERNAVALREDLERLNTELAAGLADCRVTTMVTGHASFGYLAARYGLAQVGVTGLSPDTEPSPRRLAEVADTVEALDVTTVYVEPLVSPAVARTVAAETGATTAVLDPLEGLTERSSGSDYLEVMRANLDVLRQGQSCG